MEMPVKSSCRRHRARPPAARPPPAAAEVRAVWAANAEFEFSLIRTLLSLGRFAYAAIDTEFPGVVVAVEGGCPPQCLSAVDRYALLKANVDKLHLIQVGLTLASADGRDVVTWEINLGDFDPSRHPHAPASVALLREHGVDLDAHRARGLGARRFARLLFASGLVGTTGLTWVAFHSAYDFGYLVKAAGGGQPLPKTLPEFMYLVRVLFGHQVFDVKYLMCFCDKLFGGLERVAAALSVDRAVGKSHQAGSDSRLTWDVYCRLVLAHFSSGGHGCYAGVIYGLEHR